MKVTDPVCGMEVRADRTAATSEYRGKLYLFCTEACRKQFEEDPDKYVASS